jgi:hypothetical protein
MHRKISFVDTTILCNLIPVPGRAQDRELVAAQMRAKERAGEVLILPVTAVVEAGNFIAQLPDGTARRTTAQTFERLMALVVAGNAPWQLHQFLWGEEFLQSFLAGADTGLTLVEHAVNKLGAGDLCILTERETYKSRTGIRSVDIWTRDAALSAYN